MRLFGRVMKGIAIAATAYGGYVLLTWLRYGNTRMPQLETALDRAMPNPEVVERNSAVVEAPASMTFEVLMNCNVMDSPIALILMDTRAIAMGAKPQHKALESLIDQLTAAGWVVIDETPGREVVLGVAAQPWRADAGFRPIPAAEFATFNEPGWVKIAMNFSVDAVTGCCALVATETRAMATDSEARKRFRRYWALVSPGVKLIRHAALHNVRKIAEARARVGAA